jgi:hypothetical protein
MVFLYNKNNNLNEIQDQIATKINKIKELDAKQQELTKKTKARWR